VRFSIKYFLNGAQKTSIQHKAQQVHLQSFFEGEQEERARVGREIHDSIGAMLLTMTRRLEVYKSKQQSDQQAEEIDEIISMIRATTKELRNTVHNLIPEAITLQGLEETIDNFCKEVSKGKGLEIQLYINGDWASVNQTISFNVFRIVQEAVHNIVKHSAATIAAINIVLSEGDVKIIIEDNGRGMEKQDNNKGNGLRNISWRVASLKGIMSIESAKGKGTIIHISIPYKNLY
jgi:signal transduction histidine kinase